MAERATDERGLDWHRSGKEPTRRTRRFLEPTHELEEASRDGGEDAEALAESAGAIKSELEELGEEGQDE